jgi:ABC-type molybdenum transport system ATPase subunit/photorepair protein PhrA
LAAASQNIRGLHPGFVVLDEPLQQNPDAKHRELFLTFLSKQLAKQGKFQTIMFTWLPDQDIATLRKQGTKVMTPEGKHFLKPVTPLK